MPRLMDNNDTTVDGRCRFHTSIQLNLLTRNGKRLQILKECPLCLAYEYNNISSRSNSILTTSQKSFGFTEQTNGELPPVKSSSPTSVIPMTYNRLATPMILPPLPLPTKEKTKAALTQTSSSPQLFLPSKSIVNRHDKEYVESTKLAVCRINDEVCYVTTQKDCLPAVLVNNLIQEVSQSKRLMTRSKFEEGDHSDRTGSTHFTSSTTKSSISQSDDHSTESSISKSDDHSHKRSNSVPVSCFRRTPSLGSHTDAPSLSTYSTSQDSDCSSTSRMSFCSCDSLGRCIYHPNIQLKTRRTLEGLMTGKWNIIMTSCSECAFEKIQRLRQQILDTSDSIRENQHQGQLTHPSCNILNSLTCSEKDPMRRLISSCEEVDLSDRTDSTQSTLSSWTTKSSFSKSDDHSHKRSKSAPISCIRKRSTLSEGSKRSLNRVVFAEQDDIHVFVRI